MGDRLRRYIQAKRDPAGAITSYLGELDKTVKVLTQAAIRQLAEDALQDLGSRFQKLKKDIPKMAEEISSLMIAEIKDNPERYRGAKGVPGDKGESVKGDRGDDGQDGLTPIVDVDYPSKSAVRAMVKTMMPKLPDMMPLVQKVFKKYKLPLPPANKIARALEKLQDKERLDYYALKNLPEIPKKSSPQKGLLRGGGEKVEYYDLSSLCDGVTKVFTIPRNKRVLLVLGTDSPAGQYRQGVDYTGSGTTTLTLTNEVAAPTAGATLHIIYVP